MINERFLIRYIYHMYSLHSLLYLITSDTEHRDSLRLPHARLRSSSRSTLRTKTQADVFPRSVPQAQDPLLRASPVVRFMLREENPHRIISYPQVPQILNRIMRTRGYFVRRSSSFRSMILSDT